jgi:glutathione S-transferase
MSKLTLVSSHTCPYVQRAVIALKEKGAAFDVVYVDLQNRPDWFVALSPLGKVPVMRVERPGKPEAVIFESSVIVEFVEETAPGPKLHPADPVDRAQHRAWMEFGSSVIGDLSKMNLAKDEAVHAAARDVVLQKLGRVEQVLSDGPYFAGEAFSYVDAVFAPAFRQLDTLETKVQLDLLAGLPKCAAWRAALAARPSVQAAVPGDYADRFLGRLQRMGSHLLKQAS